MIVILDTNVLFAGLHSSQGASHQILRMVLDDKVVLALSNSLCLEYEDVLTRRENLSKLGLSPGEVGTVLDALIALAMKQEVYYRLRPNLQDERDNMLMECAWASNADYLVTHNTRHFPQSELRGLATRIVTPREFMNRWRDS